MHWKCVYAVGLRILRHVEPGVRTRNETHFFPAPCDVLPGRSIMTKAAAILFSSPRDDSLSSVCLPFIRTLVAGHPPDAQLWLSHKENISFLGCCYYNSEISFAFMAASHLESLFDVVISLGSWCSWWQSHINHIHHVDSSFVQLWQMDLDTNLQLPVLRLIADLGL